MKKQKSAKKSQVTLKEEPGGFAPPDKTNHTTVVMKTMYPDPEIETLTHGAEQTVQEQIYMEI